MSAPKRGGRRKQLPPQMLLGQEGINHIERVVLAMRCRWSATGAVDAGIDGVIELTDAGDPPHPLGLLLHVQSRATDLAWPNETTDGFSYHARSEELTYWLAGNAPVLLVLSRPRTREAYWVSIKDYFSDPERRRGLTIHVDKHADAFDATAYMRLFELGRRSGNRDRGLYLAPARRTETLSTNLVPITSFGPRLYVAQTDLRRREDVFARVRQRYAELPGDISVFLTTGKTLLSPYDLRREPWSAVCDQGSVEDFDAAEWAASPDADRQREYAGLLRLALRELLYPHVRLWRDLDLYAFYAFGEERERHFRFTVAGRQRNPSVVRVYRWSYEEVSYVRLRHLAMQAAIRHAQDRWFIEITPSYLYTRDGRVDPRHEELLSGIKRLERQPAVLAHVQLWAAYLGRPAELLRPAYRYLAVGDLLTATASVGILDAAWQTWESVEPSTEDAPAEVQPELLWT